MSTETEIWVVSFSGQGHLFPCMELCKHFALRNSKTNFIISSNLSSSIPSSFRQHPDVEVLEIPSGPPGPPAPGSDPLPHQAEMVQAIEKLLSERAGKGTRPVCAVIDVMMGWMGRIFNKFGISTIGFFTSGACSTATEHATWRAHPLDIKPGETRLLPGLPEEMGLTESDLKRGPHGPPGPGLPTGPPGATGPPMMGLPKPGEQPLWIEKVKDPIALMINTCDDLERPFIEYLANELGKPVWGVGPLLPEQFWKSAHSLLHDREIRSNRRRSNVTEDEVIEWLDSKPHGSVLYVSFGSEVSLTMEEHLQLADALESSARPFIWVIQPGSGRPGPLSQFFENKPDSGVEDDGYFPHGMGQRVGKRGLIIKGWAPQLLILSHPSTGGFLSHCGWNSMVEAIGRGVPLLAWPIMGDQYYNAKLVARHLKVGCLISDDMSQAVKKDGITKRIEALMGDEEMKNRAANLSSKFHHGFPASSVASLDAFRDFIRNNEH